MKIVCLSDTHSQLRSMRHPIPPGDVLVHAGDLTWQGIKEEVESELAYLESLPHPHKIIVAGNHDFYFDERFADGHVFRDWVIRRDQTVVAMMQKYPTITYLQDDCVHIDGKCFYGSPWQPYFYDWAFNFPAVTFGMGQVAQHDLEAARATWEKIPFEVTVLITHGPPRGILDNATEHGDNRVGCPELRAAVEDRAHLKAHIFGHIHEQAGLYVDNKSGVHFVNAAICTRAYKPKNKPFVIEIQ